MDDLERDGAVMSFITGEVYGGHAAAPELLLDEPIESETLPDEAEPALEAEEAAVLAAWTGRAQAAAKTASRVARERADMVISAFVVRLNTPMVQAESAAEKA